MHRKIAMELAYPTDFWAIEEESPPSLRSECKPSVWLSREEALVLVLFASVGLWAAIWGVIALLAVGEGW
jgi:hypothetical protein